MLILLIKLAAVALCSFLYRAGGSSEFPKSWRRFGCAVVITATSLFHFSWYNLLAIPLLALAFSLGYGKNSTLKRFLKSEPLTRAVCGLAYSAAALPIMWGNWWALGYHLLIVTTGVCLAGTQKFKNQNAITEEGFIGTLVALVPIMA